MERIDAEIAVLEEGVDRAGSAETEAPTEQPKEKQNLSHAKNLSKN